MSDRVKQPAPLKQVKVSRNYNYILLPIILVLTVIAVYLGFQNTLLEKNNELLQTKVTDLQVQIEQSKSASDAANESTKRLTGFVVCLSLTPIEERTVNLIQECQTEALGDPYNPRDRAGTFEGSSSTGNNAKPQSTGGSESTNPKPPSGVTQQPQNPSQPQQPNVNPQPQQEGIVDFLTGAVGDLLEVL